MAEVQSRVNRFYLVLGAVAVVGVALLAWLVMKPKGVSIPVGITVEVTDTSGFRGYLLGSDSAPVEVTEYADYQCPACRDFEIIQFPTIQRQLIETGLMRWRYRDFPLDNIHAHARIASHAAACANDQGKYWEMHRMIYERQAEWAETRDATGTFRDMARVAGLELGQYDACMTSAKYAGRIQASANEGSQIGVPATPSFLIGGRLYPGVMASDSMRALVQSLSSGTPAPPKP